MPTATKSFFIINTPITKHRMAIYKAKIKKLLSVLNFMPYLSAVIWT